MIYKILVCLTLLVSLASSFRQVASSIKVFPFLGGLKLRASMQTSVVQLPNIEVTCKGLSMTDAIQEKIEKKIDAQVKKLGENQVVSTHITLSLEPRSQIVDVRCNMKGGAVVEARVGSESMYTSARRSPRISKSIAPRSRTSTARRGSLGAGPRRTRPTSSMRSSFLFIYVVCAVCSVSFMCTIVNKSVS